MTLTKQSKGAEKLLLTPISWLAITSKIESISVKPCTPTSSLLVIPPAVPHLLGFLGDLERLRKFRPEVALVPKGMGESL